MIGTKWTQAGRGETLERLTTSVVFAAAFSERLTDAAEETVTVIQKAARGLIAGMQARTALKLTGTPVTGADLNRIREAAQIEIDGRRPTVPVGAILVWRP